jgi:hypothetical protein
MVSSEMLRRVAHVTTDVSEELSASFIRVTRIGGLGTTKKNKKQTPWPLVRERTIPTEELGTTLAVTSNGRTLRRNITQVPPKRRFLQERNGVTFQKTPFFISESCSISIIRADRAKDDPPLTAKGSQHEI